MAEPSTMDQAKDTGKKMWDNKYIILSIIYFIAVFGIAFISPFRLMITATILAIITILCVVFDPFIQLENPDSMFTFAFVKDLPEQVMSVIPTDLIHKAIWVGILVSGLIILPSYASVIMCKVKCQGNKGIANMNSQMDQMSNEMGTYGDQY